MLCQTLGSSTRGCEWFRDFTLFYPLFFFLIFFLLFFIIIKKTALFYTYIVHYCGQQQGKTAVASLHTTHSNHLTLHKRVFSILLMSPAYPIRRRPRECKTCLPCRAGKVRCDRNVPCGNCVRRNQPSSCVYGRPPPPPPESTFSHPQQLLQQQQQQQQPTPFPSTYPTPLRDANSQRDASEIAAESLEPVNLSQEEWDQICTKVTVMEETLDSLRSLFNSNKSSRAPPPPQQPPSSPTHPESEPEQSPQSEGVYGPNAANTDPVHLGPRSVLVDILTKSKDSDEIGQALPKDNLLTDLALGNESAAYPFADLWSSDPYNFNIAGVCGVLPDDQQCHRYLNFASVWLRVCPTALQD